MSQIESRVPEAERSTIRHAFRDQDFVEYENRDPFVREQPTLQRDPTTSCVDQVRAASSYADLRIVGIITEKTQRRALMMGSDNLSVIVRKGDCVGREKAVVKEVGAEYLRFRVGPDDVDVYLYPN